MKKKVIIVVLLLIGEIFFSPAVFWKTRINYYDISSGDIYTEFRLFNIFTLNKNISIMLS